LFNIHEKERRDERKEKEKGIFYDKMNYSEIA